MPFSTPIDDDPDSLSTASPLARYRAAVRAGTVQEDPLQIDALKRLELLQTELAGYVPAGAEPPRWLGWLKRDRRPVRPKGLYIHGSVGRGKSMVMDLFFAAAPVQKKRRVHFHAFMAEIHARLHILRREHKDGLADPLAKVADEVAAQTWLLCFDEFVVNDIADAMILGRLFQALFDRGLVMVATSNFPPGMLYKDGLHRDRFEPFIALLEQTVETLTLDGPRDYRRLRRLGEPVYFAPLGPDTSRALDAAFLDLTDEKRGQPDSISVHGRTVPVPQAARGVARFNFDDLCAKPLGASDYLALAQKYHTVILDHVPLLSPANHNEARRFITLIDALYEAKTKLIMGAEALPDALYPDGRGAFEFQRTASRLMEMQSEDYRLLPATAAA
ncbi:cell division protein ZapE [Elstera cyanobacteriorum]|uniref:Cell division protein ZapE n=1 Tax=Elstera cyanobacteriorum TaxID=2022747 RepID=A0A255XS94_9PROT|nr:cell division protein ZapE [Elstera cyanobacteriorum]MCK6441847.1 AFG1 family ATPase [Elstera cyanobacteriorum]OYQ19813.1 hypothetical protein CHR90_06745 [Elstera cyanobacteriorum]GFZ95772.1 cell division protein ZapE [Elstera cyanobacteriorum]